MSLNQQPLDAYASCSMNRRFRGSVGVLDLDRAIDGRYGNYHIPHQRLLLDTGNAERLLGYMRNAVVI